MSGDVGQGQGNLLTAGIRRFGPLKVVAPGGNRLGRRRPVRSVVVIRALRLAREKL